jgi:DHA2 family multidrug resistance protein
MSIWTERRTIVAYALSILALAEIIDLTIVSVAIPDLMGALGANINDISLTMTSYIVAAAICIPLTGLVTKKYGTKNVALVSTLIFGIASILCGTATDLNQMIIYRLIQGIGGAFLPALAQSYVVANFNEQEQPKVMSLVTICIVLGPIIGPVMGGTIIENWNWRWVFYVNVPVCTLGFVLVALFMEQGQKENVKIDFISFFFMLVGVGCLEYFVDEGNTNQWFQSIEMICFFAVALIFIGFFVWRGRILSAVVNFKIFENTNFILSCIMMFVFFAMLSGGMTYFSSMLQNVYGMPVDTAGYLQVPRGVAAVFGAPIYLTLSKKIDGRILMSFAMVLSGVCLIAMGHMGPSPNIHMIFLLVFFQGFGMIGVFVLLMSIAYIGIPENLSGDCSGVFNFARNFSMSIGTSIAATILSTQQQVVWGDLAQHVSDYARGFHVWSQNLSGLASTRNAELISYSIQKGALFQSYLDLYYMSGWVIIGIFWMPFILKRPNPKAKPVMAH